MPDPLSTPAEYQAFIYALPERYTKIRRSTLVYIPSGELIELHSSESAILNHRDPSRTATIGPLNERDGLPMPAFFPG